MSLFDVAADLSQFAGDAGGDELRTSGGPDARAVLQTRSSTLCLLDETLRTIYDAGRSSAGVAASTVLRTSKSSEQLERRLRELSAPATLSAATQPPAQENARQRTSSRNSSSSSEADMTAKTILRQLSDEVEQLAELRCASSGSHAASAVRFLSEKFIDARLNKLPPTPFVQLARKKALLKIQQLERQQEQASSNSAAPPTAAAASAPPQADADSELWRRLGALSTPQHALLQRLARVPEAQVNALPAHQRELARFARRYALVRAMSARDIAQLPPHQQQVARQLQLAAKTTH